MANTPPALVASGDIRAARFVKMSGEHSGAEADANDPIIGIAGDETNYPPLSDLNITALHASSGQPIRMLGDGEIGLLEAGGSFSAGVRLKSDADGKGVAIATSGGATQHVGAVALQDSGGDGEKVRVQVQIGAEEAPA